MNIPLFSQGFRAFFLLAAVFSLCTGIAWALIYFNIITLEFTTISSSQWHAHEMIYGYSVAVIAGFLLTAVSEWTGINTTTYSRLLSLATCWLAARVLFLLGYIATASVFDLIFLLALNIVITLPILQSKLHKHIAIVSKTALLFIFNLFFYLHALGYINHGVNLGIYGGFYLIIGLILMMGRRLLPPYIESIAPTVTVKNSAALDRAGLLLFFVFFFSELIQIHSAIAAYSALALFVINAIRLVLWYTPNLWKTPFLWVMYLALWFITGGFLLFFLSYFALFSKFLAVHALAYGGLGLMTLSMMARVSFEYTRRNTIQPHSAIVAVFIALIVGGLARTLLPIFAPSAYLWWVALAMALWIFAFTVFLFIYVPVLFAPSMATHKNY